MKKVFSEYFSRLKENRNNIIISVVSGAIAGAIIGALFWLVFKKNKIYITSWLSTIGTFFAVFVSLYLSSKNDKSHKEEMKTMRLPYFRIDGIKIIPVPNFVNRIYGARSFDPDEVEAFVERIYNKSELSVKILNINEVEALLDFEMVVRLAIISNIGDKEGFIYCSPIKEISASLEESKYSLKLAGTEYEQIEQLYKLLFLNKVVFSESQVRKICNEYSMEVFSNRITYVSLLDNPMNFDQYWIQIENREIAEIAQNPQKFQSYYHLAFNNIYISCKTVLGTEVMYEYSSATGETYYRTDKEEIYAGFEVNRLKLEDDIASLHRVFKNGISLAKKDKPLSDVEQETDSREEIKRQAVIIEEYKKLHHKLNKIRLSKGMKTFTLKEIESMNPYL